MKKIVSVFAVTVVIFIIVAGCQQREQVKNGETLVTSHEDALRIGIVLKALDSEHWLTVKKGAEEAAKELGIDVVLLAPDKESNVEMQFRMIEDLIDQNMDAIGIAPCDSTTVIPLIESANEKDIAVFTIDTNADTDVVSFIGTNNYLAGKMAGQRMAEIIENQGHVVLVTGVLEQQTHRDRSLGFKEGIKDSTLTIIEEQQANSESQLAMEVMENIIDSHGQVDGVFATNALMALGILEAIEAKGLSNDIKVIGFDLQLELLEGVKKEMVDSVVAQNPYKMGYATVRNAYAYLMEEEVESRVDTGTELITAGNVDVYKELYGY